MMDGSRSTIRKSGSGRWPGDGGRAGKVIRAWANTLVVSFLQARHIGYACAGRTYLQLHHSHTSVLRGYYVHFGRAKSAVIHDSVIRYPYE